MTVAKLKARYNFGQGNKFGSPTQAKVYGEPGINNSSLKSLTFLIDNLKEIIFKIRK
jgi:hypothetical protein